MESIINLIKTPQRSNIKAKYTIDGDILNVTINKKKEIFDFTGLEEGIAEEIIVEKLSINPIISVEKIGDIVNITAISFYNTDKKELFEVVQNG